MKDTLTREDTGVTEHTNGHSESESIAVHDTRQPLSAATIQRPTMLESTIMLPRRRRWPLIVGAGLVLLVIASLLYFLNAPTKGTSTATVTRGTIISSVETTGKLNAQSSANLSFRASGRVAKVLVKVGDSVKAGQVLAELDTDSLQRQVSQAQAQLDISQLNLQKVKNGATAQDIAAATAQLNSAKATLDSVKAQPSAEDIAATQSSLNQAQARLDTVKKGATPDEITQAQAQLDEAKANRDNVAATSANTTEQARILYVQAGSATKNFLDPTGQLEQARLNYEAAQKSEQAQNIVANAKVTQAQSALDALKAGPSSDDVKIAQEVVNQATAALNKVKSGPSQNDIVKAQSGVDAAQASLDKLNAGPSETDLAISQQQVKLAQISLDATNAALDYARITSPLNGIVLAISLDPGETANASQQVATVADTTSLRIEADVDEIDVGRVHAGQAVTVTLDAYPGVTLPGKIESIAPGATIKQGSTVYQAIVSFQATGSTVPRQGMAANVDITADRKDGVLLLPNRAIETVGNRHYVSILQGSTPATVEIETGLSNNTNTEIISGVSEGQQVVMK